MSSTRSRSGGTTIGKDVEAIEQVLAERPVADRLLEVAVGGGDDADVDLDRLRAAEALDDAFLEDAQQLDLHLARQVADLVEKERRLVGGFEAADLARQRAGVGAALAAEQLAFDERGGDRRAVDADHRPLTAGAQIVDGLGEDLFAGAGLAEQQDGGGCRRDLFDLRQSPAGWRRSRRPRDGKS